MAGIKPARASIKYVSEMINGRKPKGKGAGAKWTHIGSKKRRDMDKANMGTSLEKSLKKKRSFRGRFSTTDLPMII